MSTETATAENRIRKEVSKSGISVSRVYKSEYQKEGTVTAELRQTVKTKAFYPSKSIANSMQDNLFGIAEFGFAEQEYVNEENRVAWIDVPMGTTMEQVTAKLAAASSAGLYKVLSNKPILTDNQEYAIKNADIDLTMDAVAENQVVRLPKDAENAGQLALDSNNKPQYRQVFFHMTAPVDKDWRTADKEFYTTPSITEEMSAITHIVPEQTL